MRVMSELAFDVVALRDRIRFAGRKVAVLGDLMLDRYLWGRVDRISPEAPVPVVEIERESETLGGAGNVAVNLRVLGARPVLIGVVGDDALGEDLREAFAARGVDARGVETDRTRPTTVKTRLIAQSQQVVRFDRESRADLAGEALERVIGFLERELPGCEALVVSDYGKGVIHPRTLEAALGIARARGIPVCVDPKESHRPLSRRQHPHAEPARGGWVQGRRIVDEASLMEVGWGLQKRLDADAVLITRGPQGMSLFEKAAATHLPTVAREVFDVTGAGDTVVSVVAVALAAGADFPSACSLANHAAGVVIREVGTAACTPEQLIASLAGTES